jgi:hypothetical protein
MGPDTLQHAIVTLAAAGAAWVVIRRVFTVVKPTGGSKCASCPSSQQAARGYSGKPSEGDKPRSTVPLTFVR